MLLFPLMGVMVQLTVTSSFYAPITFRMQKNLKLHYSHCPHKYLFQSTSYIFSYQLCYQTKILAPQQNGYASCYGAESLQPWQLLVIDGKYELYCHKLHQLFYLTMIDRTIIGDGRYYDEAEMLTGDSFWCCPFPIETKRIKNYDGHKSRKISPFQIRCGRH